MRLRVPDMLVGLSLLVGLVLYPNASSDAADLKIANVFGDHMVLQREKPVAIWGWANPDEQVTITLGTQKTTARANSEGAWKSKLSAMPANATPQSLLVQGADANRKLELKDVLIGEVWLGSGQSNMAMTVDRALDPDKMKSEADQPLIRMFKEDSSASPTVQLDSKGQWTVCSPKTVGGYSATLYFFGKEVQRRLQIPVGLINSSVGGTPIESWIHADAQANDPALKEAFNQQQKADEQFNPEEAKKRYEEAVERWKKQVAKAKEAGTPAPKKPTDPLVQRQRRGNSGGLFNGKIAPLVPYTLRGVVWYQGEANAQPGKGKLYRHQLALLVNDWRSRWGDELPFAWVQLPNLDRDGEDWCLVRESMLKTLSLPKTGMAIAVDIGEAKDIHPKNKQEVGRRLALWALGNVYNLKGFATSGPLPTGSSVRKSEMVVTFSHAEGLKARDGSLTGFMIAGEDKQWKQATAKVEGSSVVVSSPEVSKPVAVRYAWSPYPTCNLVNGDGLPASPFRTDEW